MDAAQTNTEVPSCPGCGERDRRIGQLETRIAVLEQKLEAALRAGKRQAAPFSGGLPKVDPKRPGRRSGDDYGTKAFRVVPSVIDETHEAPLPESCPRCGGAAIHRRACRSSIPSRDSASADLPAVQCGGGSLHLLRQACAGAASAANFRRIGMCGQPDRTGGAIGDHLLNKELGLSQGKISRFLQALFGIKLTRGGSCQIMLRCARRCEGNYQAIVQRVQQSPFLVPDETGWRIGGWLAWMHVAVAENAVAYVIARQRGLEASALLIGEDYAGTLVHDGWASYDRFWRAMHQTCLAHLLRRCKELLETAQRGAVIFPRQVKALLRESLEIRDQRDAQTITAKAAARKADDLQERMMTLVRPAKTHAANERFRRHLQRHGSQLFTFLRQEGIDATNHQAEQAIRPAVVNRKVWGGNRTEAGAAAQSILMTVLFTASKLKRDGVQFLSQVLCSPKGHPPMLLPGTG